ncbi:MAG: accessory Sec system translocase SecA2, partial [Fuerstiella sp.]|nr:accessory Sec system translocase SecA2 [Fuerstiella sp.]
YACDITYVTAQEAGFDFLRGQLCQSPADRVQRGLHFALVDEADSMLIDEARIPLVIATEDHREDADPYQVAEMVRPLRPGLHYEVKAGGRNVSFTETRLKLLERQLQITELPGEQSADRLVRLNLALQAQVLLTIDVDYIVRHEAIELIDEFTGRVAEN